MQTNKEWDLLRGRLFFVIKKDNHLFFLILTTAPMFIKDKAQEQFGELKTRNNYTQLAGKPHAGWPTHKPKQSGTVLTSHDVGNNTQKFAISCSASS